MSPLVLGLESLERMGHFKGNRASIPNPIPLRTPVGYDLFFLARRALCQQAVSMHA